MPAITKSLAKKKSDMLTLGLRLVSCLHDSHNIIVEMEPITNVYGTWNYKALREPILFKIAHTRMITIAGAVLRFDPSQDVLRNGVDRRPPPQINNASTAAMHTPIPRWVKTAVISLVSPTGDCSPCSRRRSSLFSLSLELSRNSARRYAFA